MKRQNVRTLSLIVFTFTYLLVGAAVFDALESTNELQLTQDLHSQENNWRRKYNMSREDFKNLTNLIIRMKPYKAGTQWKFAGSFYFATTVITTIGYGHSTPKTNGGKIFCMLYALPGIPLCIVMFQSIGERMNTFITTAIKFFKRSFKLSASNDVSHTSLMLISSNITVIVILSGAAVFQYYENWSYLDSFYYCFITLTTIGFGDFVALQRNDTLAKRPDYVAFSLIFILFGLTVVSSVMNLLVLRFLTMNTEDERRDEIQAAAAAVYAYDQLRSHNNSITNGIIESNNINHHIQLPYNDNISLDSKNSNNKTSSLFLYSCCCFNNTNNRIDQINDKNNSKFVINNNYLYVNRSNRSFNRTLRNLCCLSRWNNSVADNDYIINNRRKRYTVIRDPAKVHHLAHSNCSTTYPTILFNNNNRHKSLNRRYISKSVRKSHNNDDNDYTAQQLESNKNYYLCLPKQPFYINPHTNSYDISNNNQIYNENEPGSTNDTNFDADLDNIDNMDDILLDQFSLNSIRKTKRASI